jgi:ABC-type lipoprotein export system ATPase subunit
MFQQLNGEQGITVVLVTHDAGVAGHAQRLIRMQDGQIVHGTAVENRAGTAASGSGIPVESGACS